MRSRVSLKNSHLLRCFSYIQGSSYFMSWKRLLSPVFFILSGAFDLILAFSIENRFNGWVYISGTLYLCRIFLGWFANYYCYKGSFEYGRRQRKAMVSHSLFKSQNFSDFDVSLYTNQLNDLTEKFLPNLYRFIGEVVCTVAYAIYGTIVLIQNGMLGLVIPGLLIVVLMLFVVLVGSKRYGSVIATTSKEISQASRILAVSSKGLAHNEGSSNAIREIFDKPAERYEKLLLVYYLINSLNKVGVEFSFFVIAITTLLFGRLSDWNAIAPLSYIGARMIVSFQVLIQSFSNILYLASSSNITFEAITSYNSNDSTDSVNTRMYIEEQVLELVLSEECKGSIVLIHGKSGSGKTTLLSRLDYLLRRSGQHVQLLGPELPVLEIPALRVMALFAGTSEKFLERTLTDSSCKYMSLFRMTSESLKCTFSELSQGEKQRLICISCLLSDRRYCLLDEMLSGVSPSLELDILLTLLSVTDKYFLVISHSARSAIESIEIDGDLGFSLINKSDIEKARSSLAHANKG